MIKKQSKKTILFSGLSFKLLLNYSAIFCLIIIISSIFVHNNIKKNIQKRITDNLTNSNKLIATMITTNADNTIQNYLRAVAMKNFEIVSYIADNCKKNNISVEEAQNQAKEILLSQKIGKTGYIYCLNSNGVLVVHPKNELVNKNISNYPFIQKQIQDKQGYIEYNWKNPDDIDERPKALYMTYFKAWDWIISVSSYREEFLDFINLDDLKQKIINLRFGKTGYPFIMDSKGNIVCHPKLKIQNVFDKKDSNGKYFVREICQKKNGYINYTWKNPDEKNYRMKFVIFNYIPEFDWIVLSSCYYDEIYMPLSKIKTSMILTVIIMIILFIPISLFISKKILTPLNLITDTAYKLSSYDLTIQLPEKTNDEIGVLFQSIEEMVNQFRLLLIEVKMNGDNLINSAMEMENNIHAIASSADEMNSNTENISSMAKSMAIHINVITESMNSMLISINESRNNAINGSQIAEKAVEIANKSVESMTALEKSANIIGEVTEVIKKIADKTSLLALNADIEAASAGEVGKGFAVVANEIKEFAKQSSKAADKIAKRIQNMQNNSKHAIGAFYEFSDIINSISDSSESIAKQLDEQTKTVKEISLNVNSANDNINNIASSMQQLSGATNNISMNLGFAASGNIDDQNGNDKNQYTGINISASKVTGLAKNLFKLVDKFKLG